MGYPIPRSDDDLFLRWIGPLVVAPGLAAVVWLLGDSLEDFSRYDILYLLTSFLLVIVVQTVAVLSIWRLASALNVADRKAFDYGFRILLATVGFINIYYFLLLIIEGNDIEKSVLGLLLIAIIIAASFWQEAKRFLLAFSLLLCLLPWLSRLVDIGESQQPTGIAEIDWTITDQRNIHVLSFDALISQSAYEKLFRQTKELSWRQPLREHGFRLIEDSSSPGPLTLPAFATLLKMGQPMEISDYAGFFSGAAHNPAYDYFRTNGYKLQFMYHTNYFGTGHNAAIDYYYPSESIGFCQFLPEGFGLVSCRQAVLDFVRNAIDSKATFPHMVRTLKQRIAENSISDQPWLQIAYFWTPGHTLTSRYRYDRPEDVDRYLAYFEQQSQKAAGFIEHIIDHILAKDPESIILLFGDHGAYVTRGMEDGDSNATFSSDDIHLDRWGVSFAVYPADFCNRTFNAGYNLANLLVDVSRCLSERRD